MVARALQDLIHQGAYAIGGELPTEATLAKQFGVSRPTVRAALDMLEEGGAIRKTPSRTRIVTKPPASNTISRSVVVVGEPIDLPPDPAGSMGWWKYIQFGVTQELRIDGLHRLFIDEQSLDAQHSREICQDRPRGIAVVSAVIEKATELMQEAHRQGIPLVIQGHDLAWSQFDSVGSDHARGCEAVTNWLIAQGRRRILRAWYRHRTDHPAWLTDRDRGYERACRAAGIDVLPPLIAAPAQFDKAAEPAELFQAQARYFAGCLVEHLIGPNPVDALVGPSDGETFLLAAACRILGKEPGKDVLIVGYDNYWKDSIDRQWEPHIPAATVDKNNVEIGRQLVKLLLARAEGKLPEEPQHRLIEPKLIVNERPAA